MKIKCKHNNPVPMTFFTVGVLIFDPPVPISIWWCNNCGALKAPYSGNRWRRPKK